MLGPVAQWLERVSYKHEVDGSIPSRPTHQKKMTSRLNKLSGEKLRQKGERLREEEKYLEALKVLDEALIKCQEEKDYHTLVVVLKDRFLTWKHLFLHSNDRVYLILAQKDAESMFSICQEYNLKDKFHTSYFRLAEVAELLEDYKSQVKYFKKALDTYKGFLSEKGNYRTHLGTALYRSGRKKEGKEIMLEGIKEIQRGAGELDSFFVHIWLSGVHMRLAELLRDDEPREAREHLEKAREIAKADPKLVIRRRQIEKLAKTLRT